MVDSLTRAAHRVLFPIMSTVVVDDLVENFIRNGGLALLMASSPLEYAARSISPERRSREHAETVQRFVSEAVEVSGGPLLVAADAEPGGVQRFEHLLPTLPSAQQLASMDDDDVHEVFSDYGRAANRLGVAMFLGPVLDVIEGTNEWLLNRSLATDLTQSARLGRIYCSAVQTSGVSVAAKHFPGYPDLAAHPVTEDVASVVPRATVDRHLEPFEAVIGAGVDAVMVGPTAVQAIDPDQPAGTSAKVVGLLRSLDFDGLVVSDDLDAASTMKGRSLSQVVIDSIRAGVQLLLVPGEPESIDECALSLVHAVKAGKLEEEVLLSAAGAVALLARKERLVG